MVQKGYHSNRPIFIVGMPRSGSTLIEQILASHPAIAGAGETEDCHTLIAAMTDDHCRPFPELMKFIVGPEFWELGARYDRALAKHAPGARHITDKMLSNFRFVGLIHLILPNARIIHARRDPVDTCLSCFRIFSLGPQPFSYNLGELGRYFNAYRKLYGPLGRGAPRWRLCSMSTMKP